jgi:four helix bundle protein
MAYRSFEELEVWKRACQVAIQVYEVVRESRDFSLRDQMQRAAVSIPSNIAEGAERGGKDFVRFLRVARGSAAELRTLMLHCSQSRPSYLRPDELFRHGTQGNIQNAYRPRSFPEWSLTFSVSYWCGNPIPEHCQLHTENCTLNTVN